MESGKQQFIDDNIASVHHYHVPSYCGNIKGAMETCVYLKVGIYLNGNMYKFGVYFYLFTETCYTLQMSVNIFHIDQTRPCLPFATIPTLNTTNFFYHTNIFYLKI